MTCNGSDRGEFATGLARSVLQEVAERLKALAETGVAGAIDLHSLPMTATDRNELEMALGQGEVAAVLDVAGKSEIWETRYPGVWWVRHFGAGTSVAAEQIEVTEVPEILVAQGADIAAASVRLRRELAQPGLTEDAAHAQ